MSMGVWKKIFLVAGMFSLAALFLMPALPAKGEEAKPKTCDRQNAHCLVDKLSVGAETIRTLPEVNMKIPVPEAAPVPPASRTVTYSVETRGTITANLAEFKQQSNQTLNHPKGWARLGVAFREVASGGDFTLVLSQAEQVPSFAPGGCDSQYSCNVGRYVIINQDRWLGATDSWNNAGGSLRDYRHMVVNHETGHWLGLGHRECDGPGRPAALMQQQSINLAGCTFNPWPLESELYSPRLGI